MNRKADADYLEQLTALYMPRVASALELRMMPSSSVGNWLGDLRLLVGVPFTNLVANHRMLPQESIRFFYVDDNWLDALQDGATSIGLHSTRDVAHQTNLRDVLSREAEISAGQQRRRRRRKPLAESVTLGTIRTGFLLRSAVVAGWPGLEVRGFADREGKQGIDLLRLERLAPDVMLCIFSGERGVPARIDIDEPGEGLQFGVVLRSLSQEQPGSAGILPAGLRSQALDRAIAPRWPGFTQPERTGAVITSNPAQWVPPVMRKKQGQDTRVLDVLSLRDKLRSKLIELGAMKESEQLESADFALQMVKSPAQQPFLGDQSLPLSRGIASPTEAIKVEQLTGADEDAIFDELFRS